MTGGLGSLFSFVVVIAAIPLVLWLVKRGTMAGGLPTTGLRRISSLPLSPSQKLVTVEVGSGDSRCWLVLGVTPNSISTLHTMLPQDESLPAAPPATPTATFAQLLQRLQGRGPDAR